MLRRHLLSVGATMLAAAVPTLASAAEVAAGPTPARVSVEDYIAIQQLYADYCQALDRGEGERFAATWTVDGEFTGGRGPGRANDDRTPRKGKEALTTMGQTSGTRHFNANLVITPTGPNTAKASVYLLLYTARTNPPTFVETAIYDDTLVKTAQGWKFKKRVVWRDDDDITPFKPKPLPARGR
jgi:hypothetical protein